jgi:hypothetical protein
MWPVVEGKTGERFALVTKADTLFPVYFEEKSVGVRWLRELRRTLLPERGTDTSSAHTALTALDESMVALEDARELLLRLQSPSPEPADDSSVTPEIDGAAQPGSYLVLENLTTTFSRPFILDLKLGGWRRGCLFTSTVFLSSCDSRRLISPLSLSRRAAARRLSDAK